MLLCGLVQAGIEQTMTNIQPGEQRCRAADVALYDGLRGVAKLACFACLVLLLSILLDALIGSGLRRINTSSFGVWNRIVDGKIDADVVISGSSRALTHYDPRVIEELTGLKAFNIGLNGSQTDMQLARLKTYLRHNKTPRLLIHNLDVFSLQITHDGVYDPAQYIPYLAEPAIYAALMHIDSDYWKAKFLPLYGYSVQDLRFNWILGIMGFFGWDPSEDHFLGFKPRYTAWTEDFERFKMMNPHGVRIDLEADGVKEMEGLIRLCGEQGIKVLLVYSPEYQEMQRLTMNRDQVFARFAELRDQFSVPMWDYSNSPISAGKQNFYNSQHLNADGARVFSQEVGAKILSDPVVGILAASRLGDRLSHKPEGATLTRGE